VYLGFLVLIGALLVFEHQLVKPQDLSRVNLAFFHVNSAISVLILLAVGIDRWLA
jgi:4-hydroxybenzoate polyprenyltransferase